MKIRYIPFIDEMAFFINKRSLEFKKRKLLKNKLIDKSVRIGDFCKIDKNVSIEEGTYLGDFCHLFSGENSHIAIGKFCAIGNNVHIKSRTHDLKRPTATKKYKQNMRIEKSIIIGDYVWIGDNVFIREGVIINDHAVIAANSVVVRDIGFKEIVGGIPAKLIKINNLLSEEDYTNE